MSEIIDFEELCKIIESCKGRKVSITFHTIGDRDSVTSAVALAEYLGDAKIATPDFITRSAERMLKKLNYEKITSTSLGNPEVIIILDTNTLDSLGKLKKQIQKSKAQVLFIDHHAIPQNIYDKARLFDDESFNSTASIIYSALKNNGFRLSQGAAKLLLLGIIADSAGFNNATSLTFRQTAELLDLIKTDYSELLYDMSGSSPAEIRINEINDIFKAKVEKYGNYLIIYGKTKMHANELAERSIALGADISVFWSISKDEGSISARMRTGLDKKLNLHLGKVMQDVAQLLNGDGGGHPCAAGAYGPDKNNTEQAVSKILAAITEKMVK